MNIKEVIVERVLERVNEIVQRDRILRENVSDVQSVFLKTLDENLTKFVTDENFYKDVMKTAVEEVFEQEIDKPIEEVFESIDNKTLETVIENAANELVAITVAEAYFEKQLEDEQFQLELEKDVYLDD